MKIGDLWVKLGLKNEDFAKGIKQADGEMKRFAGGMKTLAGAAKLAWGAVAAAVVKFASDAIGMTQRWGDQWNQTMAGIKGAYSAFVRQLSSGEGWTNLFANMREAYRTSKEVAAALDEIFERKTSYSYQEADTERQIAQLQLIARDSSKSEAERIAANKEIIRLTNVLGETKKAIYADEAAANRSLFAQQTGLNDAQIDYLVKEYNQNRKTIQESRNYLTERARLEKELSAASNSYGTGAMNPAAYQAIAQRRNDAQKALDDLERSTSQSVKDIAELTRRYDKGNDELVKGMAEAEVAVIRVDTETAHAQTRATALLGTLQKAAGSGSGSSTDKQLEAAARIQQRAEDSAKSELQLLSEKYDQEKALLEAFGMDVTALTNEYQRNIMKIMDVPLEKMEELNDMTVDMDIEVDDDVVQEFINKWEEDLQRMKDLVTDLRDAAVKGLSDAVQELADQFTGLEDMNPGKVFQALLTPLADLAVKEGEILVATGIGVEACKKALESLNGFAAIAAGVTLIALGAAAKSGLAALAKSGAGSTSTTSYAGAGSTSSQVQTIQTEMTVYVTGRLSGNDILLSGKKTQDKLNR